MPTQDDQIPSGSSNSRNADTAAAGMTPVPLSLLGEVLIARRKERGLTQQGLAERLGSYQEAIARMERERYRNVRLERIVQVAQALEAEVLVVAHQRHGPGADQPAEPSDLPRQRPAGP